MCFLGRPLAISEGVGFWGSLGNCPIICGSPGRNLTVILLQWNIRLEARIKNSSWKDIRKGGAWCGSAREVGRESFSHLDKNTSYKAKPRQGWHLRPLKLSHLLQLGSPSQWFQGWESWPGVSARLATNREHQDPWTLASSTGFPPTTPRGTERLLLLPQPANIQSVDQFPGVAGNRMTNFSPLKTLGKRRSTSTNKCHCSEGHRS